MQRNTWNYEIMLTEDIPLSECERITLVDHHRELCNKFGKYKCPERGQDAADAASRLMSMILALNDPVIGSLALRPATERVFDPGIDGLHALWKQLGEQGEGGNPSEAKELLISGLAMKAEGREDLSITCFRSIGDADVARSAFDDLVRSIFGEKTLSSISSWRQ